MRLEAALLDVERDLDKFNIVDCRAHAVHAIGGWHDYPSRVRLLESRAFMLVTDRASSLEQVCK